MPISATLWEKTLTGGGYLVVPTGDRNRIGFPAKDPEAIREKFCPD